MELSTNYILSNNNKNTSWSDTNSNGLDTKGTTRAITSVCQTYTGCIRRFFSITAVLSVLCQPSYAERLTFLDSPYNNQNGESVEIRTPTGHSCRHTSPRGPEVTIGGGYTTEPIAGIAVRIPLGSTTNNCDAIIQLEEAQIKIQNAMSLFQIGLITREQLEVIAQQTYNTIHNN